MNEESNTPMKHSGRPTQTDIDYSDPATWTSHDDQLRQQLVQHGPMQIFDMRFPRDKTRGNFSSFHYQRHLPAGEVMHRKWLQYSVSTESVMCFCCKLVGLKRISSLSSIGLRVWKNLSSLLSSHEKLPDHLDNVGKWKELEQRLKKHKTIDDETRCARERVENYCKEILELLIALVRVLGVQNLSFRGTNEKLHSAGIGNFLKFVELIALFDPFMSEHLCKMRNEETHVHYLGKNIQNELIDILANAIKEEILRNAHAAKYFSIILDSTPDMSQVEQMTAIIRFV
ncbi:uncharacterized protein [Palaemon carinicauda]|uniref:uncharacterized protein n=1 Tax=Palaemon carinicauda TaxID=392227 RepID=UPI0035B5E402